MTVFIEEYGLFMLMAPRPVSTEKINALLVDIKRNVAMKGTGKPEPLKHGKSGLFSRRSGKKLLFSSP